MAIGDRIKHLAPNDPRGWPRCQVCARPVAKLIEVWAEDGHAFFALCHGAVDPIYCGELDPTALDGPAFVPPKAALPP